MGQRLPDQSCSRKRKKNFRCDLIKALDFYFNSESLSSPQPMLTHVAILCTLLVTAAGWGTMSGRLGC